MVFWFTDFVKFLDPYLTPGVRPSAFEKMVFWFSQFVEFPICKWGGVAMVIATPSVDTEFVEFKNFSDSYIAPGERPPVDPWRGRRVPIHGVIEPQMPTVDDG